MSEMTPKQKENFRKAILRVLDANGTTRFGLSAEDIAYMLPRFAFTVGAPEVDHELNYLAGEPLCHVELVDKKGFTPGAHAWRITTRGMNFLEEQS